MEPLEALVLATGSILGLAVVVVRSRQAKAEMTPVTTGLLEVLAEEHLRSFSRPQEDLSTQVGQQEPWAQASRRLVVEVPGAAAEARLGEPMKSVCSVSQMQAVESEEQGELEGAPTLGRT